MQRLAYLSNTREYAEKGDVNKNQYFKNANGLLGVGWKVANITPNIAEIGNKQKTMYEETFAAFAVLEKHKAAQ